MKFKVHGQVQRRQGFPFSGKPEPRPLASEDEIRKFFLALDSYSSGAVKEPAVTFHQHLRNIILAVDGESPRLSRLRRR